MYSAWVSTRSRGNVALLQLVLLMLSPGPVMVLTWLGIVGYALRLRSDLAARLRRMLAGAAP